MTELISLLALSICLALLAAFLLICYSDYRRMKRENLLTCSPTALMPTVPWSAKPAVRAVSGRTLMLTGIKKLRTIEPLSTHI